MCRLLLLAVALVWSGCTLIVEPPDLPRGTMNPRCVVACSAHAGAAPARPAASGASAPESPKE
jgi:hypothetical protein